MRIGHQIVWLLLTPVVVKLVSMVGAEWVFLTCAETRSVEFNLHMATGERAVSRAFARLSSNYFYEQQPVVAEASVPLLGSNTVCNAAFCEAATDVWMLDVHIRSSEKISTRFHVSADGPRGLGGGTVLFSNVTLVSQDSTTQSGACSSGPYQVISQKGTDCAALILRTRTPPCGMQAVMSEAQGCPPEEVLTAQLPALLSGRPYQEIVPDCGRTHPEAVQLQAQAMESTDASGHSGGLRVGFWRNAAPHNSLTFPNRAADFERCDRPDKYGKVGAAAAPPEVIGTGGWMLSMTGELQTHDTPHPEQLLYEGTTGSDAVNASQHKLLCLQHDGAAALAAPGIRLAADHAPAGAVRIMCAEAHLPAGWHGITIHYAPGPLRVLRLSVHEPLLLEERYPGRFVIHYESARRVCPPGQAADNAAYSCVPPVAAADLRTAACGPGPGVPRMIPPQAIRPATSGAAAGGTPLDTFVISTSVEPAPQLPQPHPPPGASPNTADSPPGTPSSGTVAQRPSLGLPVQAAAPPPQLAGSTAAGSRAAVLAAHGTSVPSAGPGLPPSSAAAPAHAGTGPAATGAVDPAPLPGGIATTPIAQAHDQTPMATPVAAPSDEDVATVPAMAALSGAGSQGGARATTVLPGTTTDDGATGTTSPGALPQSGFGPADTPQDGVAQDGGVFGAASTGAHPQGAGTPLAAVPQGAATRGGGHLLVTPPGAGTQGADVRGTPGAGAHGGVAPMAAPAGVGRQGGMAVPAAMHQGAVAQHGDAPGMAGQGTMDQGGAAPPGDMDLVGATPAAKPPGGSVQLWGVLGIASQGGGAIGTVGSQAGAVAGAAPPSSVAQGSTVQLAVPPDSILHGGDSVGASPGAGLSNDTVPAAGTPGALPAAAALLGAPTWSGSPGSFQAGSSSGTVPLFLTAPGTALMDTGPLGAAAAAVDPLPPWAQPTAPYDLLNSAIGAGPSAGAAAPAAGMSGTASPPSPVVPYSAAGERPPRARRVRRPRRPRKRRSPALPYAPDLPSVLPCDAVGGTRHGVGRSQAGPAGVLRIALRCGGGRRPTRTLRAAPQMATAASLACCYPAGHQRPRDVECGVAGLTCHMEVAAASNAADLVCKSTPELQDIGIFEAMCEVREPAPTPESWGTALAAVTVLSVVHGEPEVAAVDILHEPGTMYGAVQLEAVWPFHIPLHLLGIVQLSTSASVAGFGADIHQPQAANFTATVPRMQLPSPFDSLNVSVAAIARWEVQLSSGVGFTSILNVTAASREAVCRGPACEMFALDASYTADSGTGIVTDRPGARFAALCTHEVPLCSSCLAVYGPASAYVVSLQELDHMHGRAYVGVAAWEEQYRGPVRIEMQPPTGDIVCTYRTEQPSCRGRRGLVLHSPPVLQLEVQESVPFKATAVDLGHQLGGVCASSGGPPAAEV